MTGISDTELLSFAAEVLEKNGGLVERQHERLVALLPAHVSRLLGIPEEIELGADCTPLLYGSPLLDRLVKMATAEVPVVYWQIEVPYLKKAGFEQLIGKDLSFTEGEVRVGTRAEARTTYMALVCYYIALSDERKEGLVQVGVHEESGALIEGLNELWSNMQPQHLPFGKIPVHFSIELNHAVSCAIQSARLAAEAQLSDFFSSMQRCLHRDVKNTREYYEALRQEMEAGLSHPNLTEMQRQERMAKIQGLPQEVDRKIEDIKQKYQVQLSITGCAAMRFLVSIVWITLELKYRKLNRSVRVIWNPITRRLDPLICERCHQTIRIVYPFAGHSNIELLCLSCSQEH